MVNPDEDILQQFVQEEPSESPLTLLAGNTTTTNDAPSGSLNAYRASGASVQPAKSAAEIYNQLHPEAATRIQRFFELADERGLGLKPGSMNRDYGTQAKMYADKQAGLRGAYQNLPVSPPGSSTHMGFATDFSGYKPEKLQAIRELAKEVGLVYGGNWSGKTFDPVHIQLGPGSDVTRYIQQHINPQAGSVNWEGVRSTQLPEDFLKRAIAAAQGQNVDAIYVPTKEVKVEGAPNATGSATVEPDAVKEADAKVEVTKKRKDIDFAKLIKMLDDSTHGGADYLSRSMQANAQQAQANRSRSLAQIAQFDQEQVNKMAEALKGGRTQSFKEGGEVEGYNDGGPKLPDRPEYEMTDSSNAVDMTPNTSLEQLFQALTGGRNLQNDLSNIQSRLPTGQDYGHALLEQRDSTQAMNEQGRQNLREGYANRDLPQMLLGTGQGTMGLINPAMAPINAGFEVLSKTAGKFDPRAKVEAELLGLVGTEGTGVTQKLHNLELPKSSWDALLKKYQDSGATQAMTIGLPAAVAATEKPKTIKLYHGGADVPLSELNPGTFFAPERSIAEDYLKLGTQEGGGKVHEVEFTPKKMANQQDVRNAAEELGWVEPEYFPPAGFIDSGVYGKDAEKVIELLKAKGFDSAAINDIGINPANPTSFEAVSILDPKSAFSQSSTKKPAAVAAAERPVEAATRSLSPVGLYSHAAEMAEGLPQAKGTPEQMRAMLFDKYGVKPAELEGFEEKFFGRPSVTKEELATHFRERMPQVEEKVLGTPKPEQMKILRDEYARAEYGEDFSGLASEYKRRIDDLIMDRRSTTKFEKWSLPGGENYREVQLALKKDQPKVVELKEGRLWGVQLPDGTIASEFYDKGDAARAVAFEAQKSGTNFYSSHWKEPDVLTHIRMSDRTGPKGEKLLHVEEMQSDWGQQGRKEGFWTPEKEKQLKEAQQKFKSFKSGLYDQYEQSLINDYNQTPIIAKARTVQQSPKAIAEMFGKSDIYDELNKASNVGSNEKIPSGPYVTSTQGWTDLALKRVLKEAAEGGYDGVVFTPGAEQAKRYDLSNTVDRIGYNPDTKELNYVKKNSQSGPESHPRNVDPKDLPSLVGKEVADKLLNSKPNNLGFHVLAGDEMTVGGEGMKGYYDKIVPTQLQKMVKGYDKDVKLGTMRTNSLPDMLHLPVTEKMREHILKGQKAYMRGGRVGYNDGGLVAGNADGTGRQHYDAYGNVSDAQGGPVRAVAYDQNLVNTLAQQLNEGTYG